MFHIKDFIAMLRRSCAIAGCTAIPLTCKIEAAGSWWAGEIMVSVFFFRCVCVAVVGCWEMVGVVVAL